MVEVAAAAEARRFYILSSDCWWLCSPFYRLNRFYRFYRDWLHPCVNRRVALACEHRPTPCGAAVLPSTHVRRWDGGHSKEFGGEAMAARSCPNVVGKTYLWYSCTYHSGMCITLHLNGLSDQCAASERLFGRLWKSSHSTPTTRTLTVRYEISTSSWKSLKSSLTPGSANMSRNTAVPTSSRGRGWSLAKERSLPPPLSHGTLLGTKDN